MATPKFSTQAEAAAWMSKRVDDPFVDNRRFAFKDDPEAVVAYKEQCLDGCCGFFDAEVIVNGRTATIGCNYGH